MYVCASEFMYVYHEHAGICRSQRGAQDIQELGLQVVVNTHVVLGTEPYNGTNSYPQAISPAFHCIVLWPIIYAFIFFFFSNAVAMA